MGRIAIGRMMPTGLLCGEPDDPRRANWRQTGLYGRVQEKLRAWWSPQQIAAWLPMWPVDSTGEPAMSVDKRLLKPEEAAEVLSIGRSKSTS